MNPVPLFLIIVTLPLLLWGCGEKATLDSVNYDELEERATKENFQLKFKTFTDEEIANDPTLNLSLIHI